MLKFLLVIKVIFGKFDIFYSFIKHCNLKNCNEDGDEYRGDPNNDGFMKWKYVRPVKSMYFNWLKNNFLRKVITKISNKR